jgi:hypothetical protein
VDEEAEMDNLTDIIHDWGLRAFGEENFNSPQERALRLLEEAAELAQSEGIDINLANMVVISVFDRPRGDPMHEAGGVLLTLVAYLRTRGWLPEWVLLLEVRRVLGIPIEQFRQRNKEKIKAKLTKVKATK